MRPIKITSIENIKNKEILKEVENLKIDQVIIIFADGTYTKIDNHFEGQLKDIITGEIMTLNPIDMNWRPMWIGLRLFNAELRTIKELLFRQVNYISYYIESDIKK